MRPENAIEIWAPRFKDKWVKNGTPIVLPAVHKVQRGKNYLRITKSKAYNGLYSFDGSKVRDTCPINSNGAIDCYVVPVTWLVPEDVEHAEPKPTTKVVEEKSRIPQAVQDRLDDMAQVTWEDVIG